MNVKDEKATKINKLKKFFKCVLAILEAVLSLIGAATIALYIYNNVIVNTDIIVGDNNSIETNNDNSTHEINNWNMYSFSESDYMKYTVQEILAAADCSYKKGDYETVLSLYNLSQVENNSIALCNMAYLYENGIGVKKDIEKAVEYLKKANTQVSNRYLLSLYLLYYDDKQEEIVTLINYLAQCGDELTLEYITLRNYGLTLKDFRRKYGDDTAIEYNFASFYEWEYVGEEEWVNEVPKDYAGIKYIFEKTHHGSTDGLAGNYIGYIYKKYTLKNIDLITNKFIEI